MLTMFAGCIKFAHSGLGTKTCLIGQREFAGVASVSSFLAAKDKSNGLARSDMEPHGDSQKQEKGEPRSSPRRDI